MNEVWRGRLIYLAVWLACASPLVWLVWLGFNDGLTANPIEKIIRTLGDFGLYILILSLAITPAARILKEPGLIRFRRTVGLWAFVLVVLHLVTYLVFDLSLDFGELLKDVIKRPFITFGMAALVLLIPLAVTSTNGMMRRLGPKLWKRLHQLIYLIAPLAVVHYLLMVKRDIRPPLALGLLLALLLAWRVWQWANKPKRKAKVKAAA